jgi:hypothetical protein
MLTLKLTAGDEVWDKFENAKVPELRVGTSIPPPFSRGLLITPNHDSMTSHPVSSLDLQGPKTWYNSTDTVQNQEVYSVNNPTLSEICFDMIGRAEWKHMRNLTINKSTETHVESLVTLWSTWNRSDLGCASGKKLCYDFSFLYRTKFEKLSGPG